MRPGESVSKRSFLAPHKLAKIDDVLDEKVLDFEGQADVVQAGVIGAERNIDARFLAALEDHAKERKVLQRSRLEIGRRTDLQALSALGNLLKELGEAE